MKTYSSLFLAVVVSVFCSCSGIKQQDAVSNTDLNQKTGEALTCYQQGRHDKAAAILESIVRSGQPGRFKRERASVYYDLACNHALLGNRERALACLEKAVENGFANAAHIEKDSDLDTIRGDKRFLKIIGNLKQGQRLWNDRYFNTPFRLNISENEKIAGLSRLWSEIKYNFISFDLVPAINPDRLYLEYLPKIRKSSSTLKYYRLLQEFCAHLKDGHTKVIFPGELRSRVNGRVPIQTRLVQGLVIITKVYDEALIQKGIVPGIEITRVDGYAARKYAARFICPYWPANSEQGRKRAVFEYAFLRGPVGKPVIITCKNASGSVFDVELPRVKRIPAKWEPVHYQELENNIGYLNIKSFYSNKTVAMVDCVFSEIMNTNALVIDLRDNGGGNGRVGWAILGYLTDRPFQIFKWKTRMYRPVWRAWNQREAVYEEQPQPQFADNKKYYSKPVVLLTRARTGSMAENFCMAFRIMNRGKIIGGATAGSSGTPLFFSLPGGGSAQVVTTRGMFPDGKEMTGIGVLPDIEIYPTVADFRTGKDRVLDEAVKYLRTRIRK